jgi:hypothetical protein
MRDAQYLRAQAEFCLEVARQISGGRTPDQRPKTAENLYAEAARYHAEAAEIESAEQSGPKVIPDRSWF